MAIITPRPSKTLSGARLESAPGGFIVFDDYLDPQCSPGVRPAVDLIVERIQQHRDAGQYDIIGCLPNVLGADPADMSINSTFVLRKLA